MINNLVVSNKSITFALLNKNNMTTEKITIEGVHYRKCAYDKSYAVELVPGKFKGVKDFRLLTKTHFKNGETDTETVITMDAYEIIALYDALHNAKHLFENPMID